MSAGLTCRRCSEPMACDEKHCQSCIVWAQDTLCDCGSGASLADCSPEYGGGSTVTAICCDADGVVTTYYSDREPVIERPSAPGLCPLCDGVGEVQARLPHVLTWDRIPCVECMPAVERCPPVTASAPASAGASSKRRTPLSFAERQIEPDQGPPMPEPWEMAWANGGEVECCASGRCEVCAPGGFGGSRYWS